MCNLCGMTVTQKTGGNSIKDGRDKKRVYCFRILTL